MLTSIHLLYSSIFYHFTESYHIMRRYIERCCNLQSYFYVILNHIKFIVVLSILDYTKIKLLILSYLIFLVILNHTVLYCVNLFTYYYAILLCIVLYPFIKFHALFSFKHVTLYCMLGYIMLFYPALYYILLFGTII